MSVPHNGSHPSIADLRRSIIGIDTVVPTLDGERTYTFLDNAASTPTLKQVWERMGEFLPWYSGVHRGTGVKSVVATEAYERAHAVVGRFVGADLNRNQVIFTKNTTECINKLAQRSRFGKNDIVITTGMEHHSNDLPWRKHATVVHVPVTEGGWLDREALKGALRQHRGNVRLVAVSGASNITGLCEPVHEIARWVHEAGAKIFVDAAQLVPHRPVDMQPDDSPFHIDFLAFSAHKMYAPFGTGVLIGPTEFFAAREPEMVGGGVAAIVTLNSVEWNPTPHRDEAGSPNVIGGIALAEAIRVLQTAGMEAIASHEHRLLTYAYAKLKQIPGIVLYGPTEGFEHKVGVIPFNVEQMHPGLVAAILSTEGAIGVRNGYFCAQPYVKRLLNIGADEEESAGCGVVETDAGSFAGMVRASFGCYTNEEDIDRLVETLGRISGKEYKGTYTQHPVTGVFSAEGFTIDASRLFPMPDGDGFISEKNYSESA